MQQNSTFYFGSPRVDGDFITDYPDNLFNFNTIYPINTFIGTTTGELRDSLYGENNCLDNQNLVSDI